MGNEKSDTNIIALSDHGRKDHSMNLQAVGREDASTFIVDMLDRLMRIAAKKDQSVLVYLLSMARIEAMDYRDRGD